MNIYTKIEYIDRFMEDLNVEKRKKLLSECLCNDEELLKTIEDSSHISHKNPLYEYRFSFWSRIMHSTILIFIRNVLIIAVAHYLFKKFV